MHGSVFISHAVKDKELANALADLLMVGVGLIQSQIFCSSLAGMGIPAGKSFKDYVKEKLAGAPTVIALLTPNYYSSAFCLCEAGATWILSKDFIPLLTPATKFSEMKAVLEGTQALRIEEETALDEVRERLESLATQKTKDAWWTVKKKEFLEKLPSILSKLPKPETPSAEEYKEILKERDSYKEVTTDLEKRLNGCEQRYAAVARLKDKSAVTKVELSFSDEEEKFQTLVLQARKHLDKLPRGVVEALYQRERGEHWIPGDEWDDRLQHEIEHELLINDEGVISVNETHPKIRPAIQALDALGSFVGGASQEFADAYEEKHSDQLSFTNRGFWKRHLR